MGDMRAQRSHLARKQTNFRGAPPAIMVAAKLVRGDARDIDDSIFLIEAKQIDPARISAAISTIPTLMRKKQCEKISQS